MSASQSNTGRGRTKDVKQDQDSDSEGSDTSEQGFSNAVPGTFKYRSRVNQYSNSVEFPEPPLFAVNEVVYLVIPGQAQPAGPFMVSAYIGNKRYRIKRVDNGQEHGTAVDEGKLVVPATQP